MYRNEWEFIKDYFTTAREAPPQAVFESKFPKWEFYNTDGIWDHWIGELKNWHARHQLQLLLTSTAEDIKDIPASQLVNRLNQSLQVLGRDSRTISDFDLVANRDIRIDSLAERIEQLASGKKIIGVPSGISAIDDNFGGWQTGDFIVIAGWTGSLKSWLAMYFAQQAWLTGHRVLYFSLEMGHLQIGYRFDTLLSGHMGEDFSLAGLTHATAISFDKYRTWLGDIMYDKHPFVVVTNEDLDEVTQNTVMAKIEQWKPDLCILDYHGLFDDASGAMGETEKAKNLSKSFKRMAIKTGVPIIDITGVTMSGDHGDRPPELNEMAWTKQLAYDSDLCLALCFNEQTGVLEVVTRKTRRSAAFRFWAEWDVDKGIVKERSRAQNGVFNRNTTEGNEDEPEA